MLTPTRSRRPRASLADHFRTRAAAAQGRRRGAGAWSRPHLRAVAAPDDDAPPGAEAPAGAQVRSEELARLEAALFIAREPLPARRLAKLARLPDGTRARTLVRELATLQDAEGSAFRVESIAGGYQLLTRAPFGPWVRRILATPPETRLSAAAMETLAVIAYRQPVTRAEIEAIRGVGCEEMLRQLMERDLVAVGGRSEDLGRPNVYLSTARFLRAFGLARIEDLPPVGPSPASDEAGDGDGPGHHVEPGHAA
jgi:segregation and condensation protein B